jgi:hypothetical protein
MTIITKHNGNRHEYWVDRGNGKMFLPFLTRAGAEAFCQMMANAKMEGGK